MDETPSGAAVEVYEAESYSVSTASRGVSCTLSLPVKLGDGIRNPIAQWVQLSLQLRRERYPASVPLEAFCFNDTPLCSLRTMRGVLCLDLFQASDS